MSTAKDLKNKIEREVDQKKKSRESLLDQLAITDAEIDLITNLVVPYDSSALGLAAGINTTVKPVKDAYDDRIESGCRTDLIWEKQSESQVYVFSDSGVFLDTQITWKVVKNKSTADFIPYYGLKYYQKPLDRDYGSTIIDKFTGSVEIQKPVIAITQEGGIPAGIQTGDTITDSLDSPTIFSLGNLPEVVGIGTTQAVGFVTTLTGGITTGSNQFYHFGAGATSIVKTGMVLSLPGILTTNTLITGFNSGTWPIEYINDSGILTTSSIQAIILTLDKNALGYTEESEFTVGIITSYPALFISTTSPTTEVGINFTALRISSDIDTNFDYKSNPNSPLSIGIIDSSKLGVGGSVYIDNSGDPSPTTSWEPGKSYTDPTTGKIVNPEPNVGANREDYNIGTLQWPIYNAIIGLGTTVSRYAPEGTTIRVSLGSSTSIGYSNQPPGGFPQNCGIYDTNIINNENINLDLIGRNVPKIQEDLIISNSLRKEKEKRQMYAWSLLQGSSKLREEILESEELIRQLDKIN